MFCVLPPTKKTLQPYQLQDRIERQWSNRQHRYSTRFAAMLQNKLHVFCCPSYCCSEKNKKQNNFARAAHFFCTFLCRCFARLQRETSQLHVLWRKCRFNLCGRQHFSVSYRRYIIIFMLFFPRKSSPLFFISRSSSFFVIPVSVDIKIQQEKKYSALTAVNSPLYRCRI